ncbi:unnamed protein product [Linum trigynum]|uniref:F-box domain-containing protein n=1 Tax=Linum trigynum TaxID=586398 RepID=A0AAV2FHS6_9ROSI
MHNDGIPEDLTNDILRRLPLGKCIFRFRCVSKSWRDLLSDASPNLPLIQCFGEKFRPPVYTRHSPAAAPLLSCAVQQQFFSDDESRRPKVAGYCNSLFCIADGDNNQKDLILWNPATSETKVVPGNPFFTYQDDSPTVGFGFDSATNDYKIVIQCEWRSEWGRSCNNELGIYSLRNDSWRWRRMVHDWANLPSGQAPQFHEGKLYWWQPRERDLCVTLFDLAREARGIDSCSVPRL